MDYYVLTLFPEMIEACISTSITGRAINNGYISMTSVNIRDYSTDRHKHVDDYPYGGGAGMVMQAEPIYRACEDIKMRTKKKPRIIYMTPQGRVFDQSIAKELAGEEELVFLCGHYEGIDERAIELEVTDCLSIGDYVLTGGELAALVVIDAVSRMVPGVLSNEESGISESFENNLLEYPQYTRPEEFMGMKVPEILLSGHHANIEKWRRQQSLLRTAESRPDLLKKADLNKKDMDYLKNNIKNLQL